MRSTCQVRCMEGLMFLSCRIDLHDVCIIGHFFKDDPIDISIISPVTNVKVMTL